MFRASFGTWHQPSRGRNGTLILAQWLGKNNGDSPGRHWRLARQGGGKQCLLHWQTSCQWHPGESFPDGPIIAVLPGTTRGDGNKYVNLGFDDFFYTPITRQNILATLGKYLGFEPITTPAD